MRWHSPCTTYFAIDNNNNKDKNTVQSKSPIEVGVRAAGICWAAGLLAVAAAAQTAEPTDVSVDNIVVTGVRTTENLSEVPNATTVIRLDEIEAQNDISITDLLRNLPGVHVVQPSGQGGVARIFLRGGDQNLTMVLLDGVRVNDPIDTRGSAFDFSLVNLSDVERVEIVRGPQSAVYGSDALAGVINIISKDRTDKFGGSVIAEAGTDDFFQAAVDIGGPIGQSGGFLLRASTKDDGEPVTGTTFKSDSAMGSLSFAREDDWNIRMFASVIDSDGTAFPEDSGGADLAVLREVDTRSSEFLRLGVTGSVTATDNWKINFLSTWYDQDSEYFSPGVAPGVRGPVPSNGAESNLQRFDIAVNAVVDINEKVTATFGVDYYDEDGISVGFVEFAPGFLFPSGFDFDRYVTGVFGEMHYSADSGLTLLASVRHDESNSESGETTSKVGMLYDFGNDKTSIRANWGQGFSLPGFFALASPLVGNPDLLPETSESFDLGLTHLFADGQASASVTVFHSQFNNLIDFDSTLFMMVNRDRLTVDGVEMQVAWALSQSLQLSAQATYLDLDLRNSNVPLRQRPDWRGGLAMQWGLSEDWSIDAAWLYVGETFDSSIPTGDLALKSYNRVDVVATYRFSDRLRAQISFDNLLDEDYYEAIGFPAAGMRARIGIRYRY